MSKNTWILWALILMIPGAIGLGYHFAQRNSLDARISQAADATAKTSATDEYLDMYHQWFGLFPEEKAENPWGQDPYGGPEIQKRLNEGQSDRLLADLADLDKGLKHFPDELAETLYGFGWEGVLQEYRTECNKIEMILIGAVFLLAGSGLILLGGLGKITISYALSKFRHPTDDWIEEQQAAIGMALDDTEADTHDSEESEFSSLTQTQPVSDTEKVVASNRAAKEEEDSADDHDQPGYFESRKKVAQDATPASSTSDMGKGSLSELSKSLPMTNSVPEKPIKDSYFGWAIDENESSDLETLMTTEPLTKELNELTEEVSAIRQFAAQQQDQVRKLQDGYDWMIIRRFCMRIIRSIDNIEDRIGRLDDPNSDVAMCLEDIRDELIFALESSGIEQFNPELKISFKGLEKYVEAVCQRITTDDESLCGCIAEIARPGYQYLISDDDVKIVRCAQVKLYDAK